MITVNQWFAVIGAVGSVAALVSFVIGYFLGKHAAWDKYKQALDAGKPKAKDDSALPPVCYIVHGALALELKELFTASAGTPKGSPEKFKLWSKVYELAPTLNTGCDAILNNSPHTTFLMLQNCTVDQVRKDDSIKRVHIGIAPAAAQDKFRVGGIPINSVRRRDGESEQEFVSRLVDESFAVFGSTVAVSAHEAFAVAMRLCGGHANPTLVGIEIRKKTGCDSCPAQE